MTADSTSPPPSPAPAIASTPARPPLLARLFPAGATGTTLALVAANVAIYLATVFRAGGLHLLLGGPDGQALLGDGGASAFGIWSSHQLWRALTYQFLHGGLLHIGFNMYALVVLGPICERFYGRARSLVIYLASGVTGALLATGIRYLLFLHHGAIDLANPTPADLAAVRSFIEPTVGASGALMGLMGALLASTLKRSTRANPALRGLVLKWIGSVFVFGFIIKADNLAHLGGVAGGLLLGLVLRERWSARRLPGTVWASIALLSALAVVVSFGFALYASAAPLFGSG